MEFSSSELRLFLNLVIFYKGLLFVFVEVFIIELVSLVHLEGGVDSSNVFVHIIDPYKTKTLTGSFMNPHKDITSRITEIVFGLAGCSVQEVDEKLTEHQDVLKDYKWWRNDGLLRKLFNAIVSLKLVELVTVSVYVLNGGPFL